MRVEEFASASEEEDYIVEVTATGSGKEEVRNRLKSPTSALSRWCLLGLKPVV